MFIQKRSFKVLGNYNFPFLITVAFVFALTGCATSPEAINHKFDLTSDTSITTGARQRAITNVAIKPSSRPGLVDPERIVCAEPSPDVALAVANSFGFGISIFGQGSSSLTRTQAESIAQLAERTTTIQLLRDAMYRACEAYANGAITGTTYNLIMSKNNDAMVTLMMGETAGGAFGRSLAAIGSGASAEAEATVSGLKEVRLLLDQSDAEVEAAEEKEQSAEEKLADKEAIAANDQNETTEQQADNDQEVDKAENELIEAKREREIKEEQRAETRTKSAAKIEQLIAAGSITNKPTTGTAQVLQKMQDNFLREDFADEMVAACMIELGLAPSEETASFKQVQLLTSDIFAKVQTNLTAKALQSDDPENFADELVKFQTIRNLDRTSRLSDYCFTHLAQFVTTAREQEVELEKLRIKTLAVEAAQQQALAQSAALGAFEKSIAVCNKVSDEKVKAACITAASRITDAENGIVEIGQTQQVSIVVPNATLPLVAFEAAMAQRKSFETVVGRLNATPVPNVTKQELIQEKDALDKERQELSKAKDTLTLDLDKHLDKIGQATKKGQVKQFQNQRTQLVTNLALAPASQPLLVEQARLALHQHDNEAKQSKAQFELMSKRMQEWEKAANQHIKKADALKKKEKAT
ncbi:MAG: hypothetical protein KZQ93_12680 [Candidatus Thiodiazotropha sp. (ex Monitilora ramsayi)]|nr:hypothetical protein [Candidatus Thiodiazotropha sp. (ex Monitilora ramsayi)]